MNYYKYQWWLNEEDGSYMMQGILGQYVYVNPARDLIIVRLGEDWGKADWDTIFTMLAQKILSPFHINFLFSADIIIHYEKPVQIHRCGIYFSFMFQYCCRTAKGYPNRCYQNRHLCDHCKACETCGPQIEKKLLKEKGVQMVTLDETAMTIKVVYNSKKTDLDKIKAAISKLGYDADDVKADVAAYDALDGCCKKS